MMKKRLDYIDIAKGIAIIYVVLSHISIGFLAKHVSSFYMPFFFFLSGLVFDEKKFKNYKELFLKKGDLLKKYFSLSIILLILYLILNKILITNLSTLIFGIFYSRYYITKTSKISLLGISNNALWYLPSLFLIFVLYFTICKLSKNKKQKMFFSIILFIIGLLLNNYFSFLFPWNFDTSLICVIFFCIGDVFKKNIKQAYEQFNIIKAILIFSLTLILNLLSINYNGMINLSIGVYYDYLLFVVGALSGIVLYLIIAMFISKYLSIVKKILCYIGTKSLEIFLYHMPIINLVLLPIYYNCFSKFMLYQETLSYGIVSTTVVILVIIFFDYFKGKVVNLYANKKINI